MTERRDDLAAGADQAALGQVVAEEVDRRDQRLRLQRQQPRRPAEVVAVGLGVDLDLVSDQLGVEHVGAAPEVDDVQQVDVVAQLLVGEVELVAHLGDPQPVGALGGLDQHPRQRHQAGEALGADRGLRAAVGAAPDSLHRGGGGALRPRGLELALVALAQQRQPLGDLAGQLRGIEHGRVLAPVQHPGHQLAARGVLGLEDRSLARGAVALARVAQLAVAAVVALDQPGDALAQEDLGGPLDLAQLPLRAPRVVAAVEVLGRGEVVLGLGRVGDLALDPREAEDADRIALVAVADQIELPAAVDQVEGVHLALLGRVALDRVVGELDRLAAADRGLDLRQPLRDLGAVGLGGHPHLDRAALGRGQRAGPPPRDLLQRQPQRLGVGELTVEQVQGGLQRRQLVVSELDRVQVEVLGRQRVELGLVPLQAVAGLLDLEGDPEALQLRAVGVEAAREGVVVHVAVSLDLALDLKRRDRPPLGHEEGDQRELSDQLLGVLRHPVVRIVGRHARP